MAKKVVILVRDRKGEALRMAVGATLADDEVNVFIMDDKLVPDEEMELNLETMSDLDVKIYTNNPENPYEQMSTEEIARALPDYDVIIPY
jgi:precorrin-3B methylase